MRAATKRRLEKLKRKEDEVFEICDHRLTLAQWREVFKRVQSAPLVFPLRFDPSIAAHSKFDADD